MRISLIQSQHFLYDINNPGEFTVKKLFNKRDQVVAEVLDLTENAAKQGSDLIVTTESINISIFPGDKRYDLFKTGDTLDSPLVKKFASIAEQYKTYIVAGLYTLRDDKMYNSALLFNPKGELQGIYDKTHLTAGDALQLTPGDSYPIFETPFGNLAMLVCWDLQFPEAVREVALAGADLIACPTWGWENIYGLSRAYENSIAIAAANALPPHGEMWAWSDPSCIVDNMGNILSVGPNNDVGIVTSELDIQKEPSTQYDDYDGITSMRQIRTMQRRPETYKQIVKQTPPVMERYK